MAVRCLFVSLAGLLLTASCCSLRRGDLLFHVVTADTPITLVTPAGIDHVAIYAGHDSVVEALPRVGVVTTPLHSLVSRDGGSYLRGRVRHAHRRRSVSCALSYVGQPYDSLYLPGADAIYCSELVLLSFVDHHSTPLLTTVPMTFRDSTGAIPQYWTDLYARHGMAVPEGAPGSNPGELSQRKEITVMGRLK